MVKKSTLEDIEKKIDKVLKKQNNMEKVQKELLKKNEELFEEEEKIEKLELKNSEKEEELQEEELTTLEKLSRIENNLKKNSNNIMKKVTKKDLFKGLIGASIGVLSHFAFLKGLVISKQLDLIQITLLYLIALAILIIMLYYTGFRNIEKHFVLKFMPIRVLLLFSVSIFTVYLINLVFAQITFSTSFLDVYKIIGANIILAVIGAGTADLIGKQNE